MITRLVIEGYRSIRALEIEPGALSVVTGANGAGKTNLYRALELLRAAAIGDLARMLAREGGMPSALWAGAPWRADEERADFAPQRKRGPARLRLAVELDNIGYDLSLGLPRPTDAALKLDPVVKQEVVWARAPGASGRKVKMMERKGPQVSARDEK